jgi:hypothetical protein
MALDASPCRLENMDTSSGGRPEQDHVESAAIHEQSIAVDVRRHTLGIGFGPANPRCPATEKPLSHEGFSQREDIE